MDANDAPLLFTIEIYGANFVTPGRYFLILKITGSKVNPRALKLYVGDSKVPLNDNEFTTDACLEDGDPETLAKFTDSVISFWMPPESADADIKLLVEAFQLPENPLHEGDKYGEAVFDVFPRKGTLFSAVRQKTPSSRDSQELYQFETNMTLSQVVTNEGFSANAGVIRAAVSLKQDQPKQEAKKQAGRELASITGSDHRDPTDDSLLNPYNDSSLLRKQMKAGSLANFCPRSEFPEVNSREKLLDMEADYMQDTSTDRDPVAQKQEDAGSLANFCPSLESRFDMEEQKNRKRDIRARLMYRAIVQQQEEAGSLANFCPSVVVYSDSPANETVECKVKWEDDEEESVISVWETDSKESASLEHIICLNVVQKREAKLASTCNYSDEGDRSEILDIEKHCSDEEEDGFVTERFRREPEEDPAREPECVKPKLLPVPGDPGPGPSSASDASTAIRTIQETALGSNVNSIPVQHLCGSYLAREGYCEVVVLAHGALGLPMKSDGRPPQPYIAGKSGKAEAQNQMGQSVTHASIQPTQSPSWEEILLVEFREENSKDEVLILLLADHPSKELLTEYTVPLAHLKPFHQYHLELVQPNPELSGDIRLYITLMMKMDKLPLPSAGFKVFGLEVLLRSLEAPVSSQMGPLVATGRIVADWKEYKESMLSSQPRPAGVTVTTIDFPSPHPTSFAVAGATPAQGAPQVTTAGTPQEQPQWNQSLFFIGDESSLFTVTSALVIEYYPASLAMSRDSWQLSSPVGYSYQTLDQLLLSSLNWDSSKLGLRLDNLPIEGSNLRTAIGTSPSVGMVLRLVTSQRPDQQLTAAHLSSLPVFRTAPAQQQTQQGQSFYNTHQPADTAVQTPYGLPPMNAVKTILPHFHSLYNAGPKTEPVKEYVPLANLSSPNVSTPPERGSIEAAGSIQIPPEVRGKMDIRDLAVMDYQMKEVDRYRTAMRKMATDLLHVREDCKRLEEANSRLRRELGQHDEISRLMVSSKDLDNVTHTELVQKFVLLKKKLADESSKKQDLQTRLQHLQNDLIMKNEMEKEFLKLQEAHEGQQALLQKMQSKVQKYKTIQDTCKKQEKVIVQLEQLLAKHGKGPQYNGENKDTYRTLSEQNIKLQAEVMQYKELLKTAEAKQKLPRSPADKHVNGPMSDMERLELYEKLEKAEGRIVALEKQLADNVRKWAKDKADLQVKLNESVVGQKTGFKNSYSSTSIDILDWHNGPKPPSPARPLGPRRPSPKLDPLERR